MTLSPRLEARQNQTLVMTPQLRQAIALLQMSNLALAEHVAAEVEKNPLLELAPPPPVSLPRVPPGGEGLADTLADEPGLYRALLAQIQAAHIAPRTARAAVAVAGELEDDGYLRSPLAEIAARHGLDADDLARGLHLVQGCEPSGVGARDLAECLALQLRDRDRLDPAMQALLRNLGLLRRGDPGGLRALCGVDAEDFADMLDELRALDPKPGLRFGRAPLEIAIPDIHVLRRPSGEWSIELNSDTLPRVLIDNRYAARTGLDAASRQFVMECTARANWLVRAMAQRARTILRVATAIVEHQQRFFALGIAEMRPLTQRTVADWLGLHESTVSRVASGKYLSCEHGLYPLQFFFGSAIQAFAGGEAFSAAAVQERIRHLIRDEPAERPLSDDGIAALLNADGIDIARRTVAKYREGMSIPSSLARRRPAAGGRRVRPRERPGRAIGGGD